MSGYLYRGKTWTPCPTLADGNCFFHAVFGEKLQEDDQICYVDRHCTFRRMYWAAFLMFFIHEEMPTVLSDVIKNCFMANDSFVDMSLSDPDDYKTYIKNVALGQYWVLVEEIPVLSTIWNIRIVLFIGTQDTPTVFEPNPVLLGSFPFGSLTPLREQVIRLANNHFERLSNVQDPDTSEDVEPQDLVDFDAEETGGDAKYTEQNYPKGDSAGIEGGVYQVNVLTVVLLNALKKSDMWRLSTENKEAGKFDDLIWESPTGDVLLQAKHKTDKRKVIGKKALLSSTPSDFSLAKYYVSFMEIRGKFNLSKVVICTNAKLQNDKEMTGHVETQTASEDDILHFEGSGNSFCIFNQSFAVHLKESIKQFHQENIPDVKLCISDENIKEFLGHLRVYVNFMNTQEIDNVKKGLIPSLSLGEGLDSVAAFEYVHKVINNWFINVRGRYLNHLYAKALLCEIRSNDYFKTFEIYSISFQKLTFSFKSCKRILHVVPSSAPVLNMIKILQAFKKDNAKSLVLNPADSLATHKHVLDTFTSSQHAFLVIDRPVVTNEELLRRLCNKITKILTASTNKKVVLVAYAGNKLANKIAESSNPDNFEAVNDDIRFEHLTEESQTEMRTLRRIVFQGTDMTLEELLGQNPNDFVDAEVLATLARGDKIEIGTQLQHSDSNITNYYIDRTLKRNNQDIPEGQFCHLREIQERIVLISDSAGMGKTTVLSNLAIRIKKNNPASFVVRIDLNNHAGTFKTALKKGHKSLSVTDIVNADETTAMSGEFVKKLFFKPDNVVLMLDAVDEVNLKHMNLVMSMIKDAKGKTNFGKVFVTTRPHLREVLQEKLGVEAFTLEPFSRENQVDFLTKYWTQELRLESEKDIRRCQQYARALIGEMSRWINEKAENTFAGIPLQTRMLAEVFQEHKQLEDDADGRRVECKEFLMSGQAVPDLPKRIDLIQLYQLFIATKRDIFVHDKAKTGGNALSEQAMIDKFEECHQYHRSLALSIIFYSGEYVLFGCYKRWDEFPQDFLEAYVLRAGLVQSSEKTVGFIHRTFAEYFAAQSLVLELKARSLDRQFQDFVLEVVLIQEEYNVVCAFFDSFVRKELTDMPLETLQAFSESNYAAILPQLGTSYLHLFAKAGWLGLVEFFSVCACYGVTIHTELTEEKAMLVDAWDLECNTPLHEACFWDHQHLAEALISRGANVNAQNVTGETPLHVAAFRGHLELVRYLVYDAGAALRKINIYGETALFSAALGHHFEIVKLLCGKNLDCKGEFTTALHIACAEGDLDIVRYLVEDVGADVEVLDACRNTPLHAASYEGELEVVEYLVSKGCRVNVINGDGDSPFHGAAIRGMYGVVMHLLENGADPELEDSDGYTIKDLLMWLKKNKEESGSDETSSNDGESDENDDSENDNKESANESGDSENDNKESANESGDSEIDNKESANESGDSENDNKESANESGDSENDNKESANESGDPENDNKESANESGDSENDNKESAEADEDEKSEEGNSSFDLEQNEETAQKISAIDS